MQVIVLQKWNLYSKVSLNRSQTGNMEQQVNTARFHSLERSGSTAQDAVYLLNASPKFPQIHRGELSKEYYTVVWWTSNHSVIIRFFLKQEALAENTFNSKC